jgi:hypothetical protein
MSIFDPTSQTELDNGHLHPLILIGPGRCIVAQLSRRWYTPPQLEELIPLDHSNPNITAGWIQPRKVASATRRRRSVMNSSTESSCGDLKIDVVAPCGECCTYDGVSSSEFLEAFTDNLPDPGKGMLLRIHGSTVPGLLLRRCGNEH